MVGWCSVGQVWVAGRGKGKVTMPATACHGGGSSQKHCLLGRQRARQVPCCHAWAEGGR